MTVVLKDSQTAPATPDGVADQVTVPRPQAGPQPQRLLLTILADYWLEQDSPLPSAALVELLGEFDVSPSSARTALSRLSRRGLLAPARSGRNTAYGLSEEGQSILRSGAPLMLGFGRDDHEWDGTWLFFAFSIPEERRNIRPILRKKLRWVGFAPMYDGLWVSPYAATAQVAAIAAELAIDSCAIIKGTSVDNDPRFFNPIRAWDLESVRQRYNDFIEVYTLLRNRVRSGTVGPTEALVTRTRIVDAWRDFPELDPHLPARLLPADWPRHRARDLFVEMYDTLGPLAAIRVRQVIAMFAPDLALSVTPHASDFVPVLPRR